MSVQLTAYYLVDSPVEEAEGTCDLADHIKPSPHRVVLEDITWCWDGGEWIALQSTGS